MDRKTQGLLLSELYSAQAYAERLFHALIDMSSLQGLEECQMLAAQAEFKLSELLETQVLRGQFTQQESHPATLRSLRIKMQHTSSLLRSLIELQGNAPVLVECCVQFMNTFYDIAYELHLIVDQQTNLEIQWPRLNLVQMNPHGKEVHVLAVKNQKKKEQEQKQAQEQESQEPLAHPNAPKRYGKAGLYALPGGIQPAAKNTQEHEAEQTEQNNEEVKTIPHFSLPANIVQTICDEELGGIDHLEWQREKKYEELIAHGHESVLQKNYPKALASFSKARNYRENAEVLTLIGWTHSLLSQIDKAKSYCLKAIQKDPDYGPPYNDLGSYLLSEGQIEESLKWFDLAKKAPNYQNREYPYINAGRAYMTKRKLGQALEEFSKALTLAPYHEELHDTVEKLKKSIKLEGPKEMNPEDSSLN